MQSIMEGVKPRHALFLSIHGGKRGRIQHALVPLFGYGLQRRSANMN